MNSLALLTLLGLLPEITFGDKVYYTELETLKPAQLTALQKFKKSVSSIVPEEYMKDDIYLVKWMQFNNFNVRKSIDMLTDALKWRKQVKVDQWENPEFFEQFERKGDYPIYTDGFDREGRPIVESFFGDWNVRAVAVTGKIKHLTHYCHRATERAAKKIRELQSEGKNITQFILLINMDGFNLINQACPTCLPLYLGYVNFYEKYWPLLNFQTILVNTPESFDFILNLVRPIMSPPTRAGLKVFGTNKDEWKPYIDKLIDPTQISNWYDPKGKERRAY